MTQPYRDSQYMDFNNGQVILDPMNLVEQMPADWTTENKIDYFQCRVEVWQLGVAVEILKMVEAHEPPSIWSHAAYSLVSILASYFEMVGKILNPNSNQWHSSSKDFNWGFCDVYPTSELSQPIPAGHLQDYEDRTIPHVHQFRDMMRNGTYHLAFPKKNFFIHNSADIQDDFTVQIVVDQIPVNAIGAAYLMNPHQTTWTLVEHFGGLVARLRVANNVAMRHNFLKFVDQFFEVVP